MIRKLWNAGTTPAQTQSAEIWVWPRLVLIA
jgi:hypothetical protein